MIGVIYKMEQSKEKNKISGLGLATVVLYIVATLFFQTNCSEKLLMSINNNVAFWDKYFNLLFYGLFAMFFLMIYFHQVQISVKEFEKENLKYIVGGFVFIIVTMVASAILLSCYGIGESANEEAVSRDFVENR